MGEDLIALGLSRAGRGQVWWPSGDGCGGRDKRMAKGRGAGQGCVDLALRARGGVARSWEEGTAALEHEAGKVNDGYRQTYWIGRFDRLPVDIGIEWPEARRIGCVVARYLDARGAPTYTGGPLQKLARLQYWDGEGWWDIDAELEGVETGLHQYTFEPISTTRVRLLYETPFVFTGGTFEMGMWFSDGMDHQLALPQLPLGITLSQLEVYERAPFKRAGGYWIAPEASSVFEDDIRPTLDVGRTVWAEGPCAAEAQGNRVTMENGFLRLVVEASGQPRELMLWNKVTDEGVTLEGACGFRVVAEPCVFDDARFRVAGVDVGGSTPEAARVRIDLASEDAGVSVYYELRQREHFYHKWLAVRNKRAEAVVIKDVVLSALHLPNLVALPSPDDLSYPVCRLKEGGFFACIEFPYWEHLGDALVYYPGMTVPPGETVETEKAAVGVFRNRGESVMQLDLGIREWVVEYHACVSALHESWPERYHEGWCAGMGIGESDGDAVGAERYMASASRLGIRYMDGSEATHQAMEMPRDAVRRWVEVGAKHGVHMGSWIDHGSAHVVYGPEDGARIDPSECKLSPDVVQRNRDVVSFAKELGYRCTHHDFFWLVRCESTEHGHVPGKYSVYAQAKALIELDRELHEACPGMMTSGDGTFGSAQWTRLLDGRVHGMINDHIAAAAQDLHYDRLYAEYSRGYMVAGYLAFLRPWFRTLNCVGHYGKYSRLHDRAGFRYGILSALAVAAQVGFNYVPDQSLEEEITFADAWLSWAARNRDYFMRTEKLFLRTFEYSQAFLNPSEMLEGFAHILGDRGYIFLINPSPSEQVARLHLRIDTPNQARIGVLNVYPGVFALQEGEGNTWSGDEAVSVTIPGKQIRILWAGPADAMPGSVACKSEDHYASDYSRFISDWQVVREDDGGVTLAGEFSVRSNCRQYLTSVDSAELWETNPWAYDKAYLALFFKNDRHHIRFNWVPDDLDIGVWVNGVRKRAAPFRTPSSLQPKGVCRCYFVDLGGEVRCDGVNAVQVTLPARYISHRLTFKGAYVDLPDQMPYALPPDFDL